MDPWVGFIKLSNIRRGGPLQVPTLNLGFYNHCPVINVIGMLRQQSITEMFSPGVANCFTLTRTGTERTIAAVIGGKKEIPG
jgi:hypothetical protein